MKLNRLAFNSFIEEFEKIAIFSPSIQALSAANRGKMNKMPILTNSTMSTGLVKNNMIPKSTAPSGLGTFGKPPKIGGTTPAISGGTAAMRPSNLAPKPKQITNLPN